MVVLLASRPSRNTHSSMQRTDMDWPVGAMLVNGHNFVSVPVIV